LTLLSQASLDDASAAGTQEPSSQSRPRRSGTRLRIRWRHIAALMLLALIGWFQYQIWFGRGNLLNVQTMREEIQVQKASNELMRQDNERLASDIADLREGQDKMEEIARQELGMIKPNEIFVQYTKP
jgi:cell division protein FtsB